MRLGPSTPNSSKLHPKASGSSSHIFLCLLANSSVSSEIPPSVSSPVDLVAVTSAGDKKYDGNKEGSNCCFNSFASSSILIISKLGREISNFLNPPLSC